MIWSCACLALRSRSTASSATSERKPPRSSRRSSMPLPPARTRGDRDRIWLGKSLCYGPMPVGIAISRCREMLEHARGVRWVEASILGMLAYLLAMADDPGEAHSRCFARSRAIFRGARNDVRARCARRDPARSSRWPGSGGCGTRARLGSRLPRGAARTSCALRSRRGSRTCSTSRGVTTMQTDSHGRVGEAAAADDIFSQVLWRSALAKVIARRDRDPSADSSPPRL